MSNERRQMFFKFKILDNWILMCREFYYIHNTPIIDDATYDRLEKWLEEIRAYYKFKPSNTSTSVGSTLQEDYRYDIFRIVKSEEDIFGE